MTYKNRDGQSFEGDTFESILLQLHASSMMDRESPLEEFLANVAARSKKVDPDVIIDTSTPEAFLASCVRAQILTKVA